MHVVVWIISGLLVGSLARGVMRERGYGFLQDIVLGLLGGLVGGWVFHQMGFNGPTDLMRHAFVSLIGAMSVIELARWVRPLARRTERLLGGPALVAEFEGGLKRLGDLERLVLERLVKRGKPLRDPNQAFDEQMTLGQRVADRVATYGGSWTFIGTFLLFMVVWMVVNTETSLRWDPYPFILLNLCLSCLAALQAPVIMMSQNRQAAKDRLDARCDYEVNLRAETDIQALHAKLDTQHAVDWPALLEIQQRQIRMLEDIVARLARERGAAG